MNKSKQRSLSQEEIWPQSDEASTAVEQKINESPDNEATTRSDGQQPQLEWTSQEVLIVMTVIIAVVLVVTLIGICLLQCCPLIWKALSDNWWKARKAASGWGVSRKSASLESVISSGKRKAGYSGRMTDTIDSNMLDLGDDRPSRPAFDRPSVSDDSAGATRGPELSRTSTPDGCHRSADTSNDIPMSDVRASSSVPGTLNHNSNQNHNHSQNHHESSSSSIEPHSAPYVSDDDTQPNSRRSSFAAEQSVQKSRTKARISAEIGRIDPSLYDEWRSSESSSLVNTSARRISVLPRSLNNSQTPDSDIRGKLYLSLKFDKTEGKLIVTVQRAENLTPRDFSGTVDSYVKVLLHPDRKPKYQTKTQKKTTEPVFNETFEFFVAADQIQLRTLVFSVHDFDRFSRTCLLGSCAIDMSSIHTLITHDPIDFDVVITNSKGKGVEELGDILISLSYLTNVERLTICVMKCQNLKPMDLNGYADPYIKVEVYHAGRCIKKRKTDMKKRTLTPVFNEAFIFDIPLADMPLICVIVKAYDYDRLSADDLIGMVVLGEACSGPGKAHWLEAIANQRRSIAKWHKLSSHETLKTHLPDFMEHAQIFNEFRLAKLKDKLHLGQSQSLSNSSLASSPTHDGVQLIK